MMAPRFTAAAPAFRPLGRFDVLLTAAEAYPELERETLAACERVWFFFRIFDPDTALRSREAHEAGARTWLDLLRLKARQGIELRIAISDFDPHGAPKLHEGSWTAARKLAPLMREGDVSLLIATHEARAGLLARLATVPGALYATERRRRELNGLRERARAARFADGPGYWSALTERGGRVGWSGWPIVAGRPVTHHQKLAILDATGAKARLFIGGLDVNPRRWDDPRHERRPEQTWRDLSVMVDGLVARDAAAHFAECWMRDCARAGAEMRRRLVWRPEAAPEIAEPCRMKPPEPPRETATAPPMIRFSRTLSIHRKGPLTLSPRTIDRGLERDYLDLIAEARTLLYVETQFLRSRIIGKALRRAGKMKPKLGLIVVLPAAPEPAAFEASRSPATRFGEWLQARTLRKLAEVYGTRCVIVSPARPARRIENDRATLRGAGIVYVHTKALIADETAAVVSSANLNGRSLRWDTEAGVLVRAPEAVARLRRRLFETLLPEDAPEEAFALETAPGVWARIADENAALPPERRRGFLLRHDIDATEAWGAPMPGAPEELV